MVYKWLLYDPSLQIQYRMVNCYVSSTILYSIKDLDIESSGMWFIGRMLKIRWVQNVTGIFHDKELSYFEHISRWEKYYSILYWWCWRGYIRDGCGTNCRPMLCQNFYNWVSMPYFGKQYRASVMRSLHFAM